MTEFSMRLACACLSSFYDRQALNVYQQQLQTIHYRHVSELSVQTMRTRLLLHTIAKAQKRLYETSVRNGIRDLNAFYIHSDAIQDLLSYIDDTIIQITSSMFDMEEDDDVALGSLDIYEFTGSADELRLMSEEVTNPIALLFFSNKKLMLQNTNLLQQFTTMKTQLEHASESMQQGVAIHADAILQMFSNLLQAHLQSISMEEELMDAVMLSILCYDTYNWTDKNDIETFLLQPFLELKEIFSDLLNGETP